MKRAQTPALERLEGKALLSPGLRVAHVPMSPPIVAQANQGVRIVLTTDQQIHHRGQPVVMTLTETNTSNQTMTVPLGPSTDGFYVTHNGREVWASNSGPQPQFVLLKTLDAGESCRLSATWNGHSNIGPASIPAGTLVVHSQLPGAAPVTMQTKG
jgi:hypothetical protein